METSNKVPEERAAGSKAYDPKFAVARAAKLLGISVTSTWRLIWAGKLCSYQIGGRTLVGLSHIEEYLRNAENISLSRQNGKNYGK
jgi:excisionase family DNA binding protein